jgi:hypothetical protein
MPGLVAMEFAENAVGGTHPVHPASAAMRIQTAEEVATIIADLIERPVAEVYTNRSTPAVVHRYYGDVGAFEGCGLSP